VPVDRYFAYGSNLEPARMARRVPSARPMGPAELADFDWRVDKRGSDGSGKANIRRAVGQRVWGVVYEIDALEWPGLDACEGGYARIEVRVRGEGADLFAHTYQSGDLTPDPTPFAWYKRLMVEGARHHGLPEEWVGLLEALPAR